MQIEQGNVQTHGGSLNVEVGNLNKGERESEE